jgi:lipoate-protein ligase A
MIGTTVSEKNRRFVGSLEMTEKLFGSLIVLPDTDSRSAALNMAIDEVLLETSETPTIRFYRWDHPALSFGYFGKFADVADQKRDIVRRSTGGGIVFHGEDLTYSIVIPANDRAFGESSMSIYEKVHHAIRATLGTAVAALYERRANPNPALTDRRCNKEFCFANPVKADVMLDGKKIAGAAQRRTRRGLLQQGSIQHVDLGNDFEMRFAKELSNESTCEELDDALLDRASKIAQEKYATDAWLRRR